MRLRERHERASVAPKMAVSEMIRKSSPLNSPDDRYAVDHLRIIPVGLPLRPESPEERRALVETRRKGQLPRRQFAELLPDADVDLLLSTLVAKDLLVRVGRGGGTRYELSPEVVARAGGSSIEVQRRRRQMLLDEMARRGGLTRTQAIEVLGGDRRAAHALIGSLVASGIVRAEGNTRARRYRVSDAAELAPPSDDG